MFFWTQPLVWLLPLALLDRRRRAAAPLAAQLDDARGPAQRRAPADVPVRVPGARVLRLRLRRRAEHARSSRKSIVDNTELRGDPRASRRRQGAPRAARGRRGQRVERVQLADRDADELPHRQHRRRPRLDRAAHAAGRLSRVQQEEPGHRRARRRADRALAELRRRRAGERAGSADHRQPALAAAEEALPDHARGADRDRDRRRAPRIVVPYLEYKGIADPPAGARRRLRRHARRDDRGPRARGGRAPARARGDGADLLRHAGAPDPGGLPVQGRPVERLVRAREPDADHRHRDQPPALPRRLRRRRPRPRSGSRSPSPTAARSPRARSSSPTPRPAGRASGACRRARR